jgi:hypothetical protein
MQLLIRPGSQALFDEPQGSGAPIVVGAWTSAPALDVGTALGPAILASAPASATTVLASSDSQPVVALPSIATAMTVERMRHIMFGIHVDAVGCAMQPRQRP